jgi:hypothetical protein
MGEACSTYGEEEKYIHGFGGKTWKKRDHLQVSGANGKIILKLKLNRKAGQGLD